MVGFGSDRLEPNRNKRKVEELYNAIIDEAEGPVRETDQNISKNMVGEQSSGNFMSSQCKIMGTSVDIAVTSQAEKSGEHSMSWRTCLIRESGTCNVCSAPCSSCMHLNRTLMGSKTDEFSDETCVETMASQYTINKNDMFPSVKDGPSGSHQHTSSEVSNLPSVNSTHDSFSENAESKTTLRFGDISETSEDFEMHQKLPSDVIGADTKRTSALGQRMFSNKYESNRVQEDHDDNISSIGGADNANAALSFHDRDVDIKSSSQDSDSVFNLSMERSGIERLPLKLDLADIPSIEKTDTGCSSKVQTPLSCAPNDKSLTENSSRALTNIYSQSEAETNKNCGYIPGETLRSAGQHGQDSKPTQTAEMTDTQKSLSQAVDESDDSDIVEHDVKVCDICGDAGREDLLAICSRCSDGAEHTYCMREMLEKVPEGDWLCEECRLFEESENQKQGIDAEGKRTNKVSTENSAKRCAEDLDAAPAAKRQAIEPGIGSPKSISPSKTAVLSRDSSLKSLDKGKGRPASLGIHSRNDVSETASSPTGSLIQKAKGALLKSNSFSTLHSKPKVKLVDEVIPQKQRGTREPASLPMKDGSVRALGKSMSFRSSDSGRLSTSESKSRMVSPRVSRLQDFKGLKPVNDRNPLERKHLSKLDRSFIGSTIVGTGLATSRADQKLVSRGDNISFSSVNNNRETKVVKSEGKASLLSKSNSNLARKAGEHLATPVGAFSSSGIGTSVEQKSNVVRQKDEPSSSSSWTTDRPSSNDNEMRQDGLPWSLESSTRGEKSSVSRPRSSGVSGNDVSVGKNSKGEMTKGSNLRAAISAAIPKLPMTYSRNRVNDQPDAYPTGVDLNRERDSQDQLSVSNKMKNNTAVRGMIESQASPQSCSGDLKQFSAHSVDTLFSSKAGDSYSAVTSSGKTTVRDGIGHTLAAVSASLKMSAIPEHEYVWQGGFEVHRGGTLTDLCDGVQAHLSSCASPKVLEVAYKFPQKIQLKEVPRMSTWPAKFREAGVKEENIALYFFAKDFESYESNYKGLLDSMMKNDLALKGIVEGAELLIFPSNQLPDNCKRWNMLYFLWGVFRGRKINSSNSFKKSRANSSNVMPLERDCFVNQPLSQNLFLPKHTDKDSSIYESAYNIAPASCGPDKPLITVGDCDNISLVQQSSFISQASSEQQDGKKLESRFLSKVTTTARSSPEMGCPCPSTEPYDLLECGRETELKPSFQAVSSELGCNNSERTQIQRVAFPAGENGSCMKVYPASDQHLDIEGSVAAKGTPGIKRGTDQIKLEIDLREENGYLGVETGSERNFKGLSCQQTNHRKRPLLDLSTTPKQLSDGTSQDLPWNSVLFDGQSISKKPKTDFSGCNSSRVGDESGSSLSAEEKRHDKLHNEKIIPEDLGVAEKYFFPVDTQNVDNFRLGTSSMPWKELSSNEEDQVHEVVPNLELALGAETKPQNKGILPFFVGAMDKDNHPDKPPDKVTVEDEDLSLSLSFPFPDKEQAVVKPVPRTEQLLSERHHVNTSLLLFGGYSDK